MTTPVLRRRATPTTVLLVGMLVVLAGCSSPSDPPTADATPSTSPAPPSAAPATSVAPDPALSSSAAAVAAAYCDRLLAPDQVAGLAGAPMGEPTVVQIGTTQGCTWNPTDDSLVSVQAVNASSSTWGLALPEVVASVRSAGVSLDAATLAGVGTTATAVAQGAEPDADLVCEIFEGISEAQGYGAGRDATLTALPDATAPTSVVAEACNGDEYSLLQVNGPDLVDGLDARLAEVEDRLQQLHGAPLSFGTLG